MECGLESEGGGGEGGDKEGWRDGAHLLPHPLTVILGLLTSFLRRPYNLNALNRLGWESNPAGGGSRYSLRRGCTTKEWRN